MKKNYLFNVISLLFVNFVISQNVELPTNGGEYKTTNSESECLSDVKRNEIKQQISSNVALLKSQGKIKSSKQDHKVGVAVHPLFIWPVVKNPTSIYTNVWSISNYVDHNANFPNKVQDWNCGSKTYDNAAGYNHKGIDIFTWPFSFSMMDESQAWAIAAASGIITYKNDGNFDRSCDFNDNDWNAVIIQHSDGSESWYGHLKKGSLTTKNVGDTVVEGDFLGVVGSSGNSTGPHLHFEVYNSNSQLVDPYMGTCNTWTSSSDSWWQSQKPYADPKINAVLSHSAVPQFNTCPTVETPNLSNDFNVGSNVIVAIYLADQIANSSVNLTVKKPDNSALYSWNFALTQNYNSSWWYWTLPATDLKQQGTYQFTAFYQGTSVTHSFNYGSLGLADNHKEKFSIYPNPAKDNFTIQANNNVAIEEVKVYDLLGKMIINDKKQNVINISSLNKGIYLVKIDTNEGNYTSKIIKE